VARATVPHPSVTTTTTTKEVTMETRNCSGHSPHTYATEWIDRRLPFLESLGTGHLCADCLDELEADEFVEVVSVCPIAD
jgi:hypothetical protein